MTLSRAQVCERMRAARGVATRLPFAPLERLARARANESPFLWLARAAGRDSSQIYRWRANGIGLQHADELAVHVFGCHPADIWPEWWELPT